MNLFGNGEGFDAPTQAFVESLREMAGPELVAPGPPRASAMPFPSVEAALAKARQEQPRINCFIEIEAPDGAGIPVAHKDMFLRDGRLVSAGSALLRDYRASGTATVISRLRAAGTVEIGRLNMAEFAMGPTGHNEHWGDTRNPWNPLHITGGSSSGSAAAVAAGIVPFALGSDTGGSIRVPAACCGITGLKPTYARVSRFGALHLASSLDVIGPLARFAADIAWVMDRIDGPDPLDPTCWAPPTRFADRLGGDVRAVRIGVPENYYWEGLDAEIADACRTALAAFPNVVSVKVPDLAAINADCLSISGFESGARHREGFEAHPEAYGAQVRTRLLRGLEVPEEEYEAVRARRPQMVRDFVTQAFRDVDVLAVPVLRRPVPTLAETDVGGGAGIAGILADLSYATRGFSALGLPNIVFPVGFAGGLPVGLMLAGRPYADADLVALADFHRQAAG